MRTADADEKPAASGEDYPPGMYRGAWADGHGGSPEMWLGLQMDYDLAQAQKKAGKIKVRDLRRAA